MTADHVIQGAILRHRETGLHWRVMFSPGKGRRRVFVWLELIGTGRTRHSELKIVLEKFEPVITPHQVPA